MTGQSIQFVYNQYEKKVVVGEDGTESLREWTPGTEEILAFPDRLFIFDLI